MLEVQPIIFFAGEPFMDVDLKKMMQYLFE